MSGPTPSPSLRLEEQFTGENVNAWGVRLNRVIDLVDASIAGMATVALTGDASLTTNNYVADQARNALLKFTGTLTAAATVTIPSVTKQYLIYNATNKTVAISTGAGSTVAIEAGDRAAVFCDGSNVLTLGYGSYDIKTYIQTLIAGSGNVPGAAGNAGKYLYSDGTNFFWRNIAVADVTGAAPSASPTITGGITLSGSVKEATVPMAALDMNLSAGEFFTKSISANSTFTFSNLTASKAQAWVLRLTTSSSAVPTFTGAKWTGGVAPNFGNGNHLVGFVSYDGTEIAAVLISSQYA